MQEIPHLGPKQKNIKNKERKQTEERQITFKVMSWELKDTGSLEEEQGANLDNILKSRDTTLPTKVCIVKAMSFPVVMYGCESWTIKSAEELMLLNHGAGEDSWESPGQQGDQISQSQSK